MPFFVCLNEPDSSPRDMYQPVRAFKTRAQARAFLISLPDFDVLSLSIFHHKSLERLEHLREKAESTGDYDDFLDFADERNLI